MKNYRFAILAVSVVALTGCGKIDFNLQQPNLTPIVQKPSSQGLEVVSGSSLGKRTVLNGYYVDASVGATRDQIEQRSPNGYTIYHGVKGAIVSDDE